jgi:hypothetical protein
MTTSDPVDALAIPCPACGALAGQKCWLSPATARQLFGRLEEPHTARVMAAENPNVPFFFEGLGVGDDPRK